MILSPIFQLEKLREIERNIATFLNAQTNFMSATTISSPRAVGDAMQRILEADFGNLLAGDIRDYSSDLARRAMADLALPIERASITSLTLRLIALIRASTCRI
jgi:hypothetical protein